MESKGNSDQAYSTQEMQPNSELQRPKTKGHAQNKRKKTPKSAENKGCEFSNYYSKEGKSPYDEVEWEIRSAIITNEDGKIVFEQKDVEIPKDWSMLATNVVVSKYFRGKVGTPEREHSVRLLIGRVSDTVHEWGVKDRYFASKKDAKTFHNELTYLLLNQCDSDFLGRYINE